MIPLRRQARSRAGYPFDRVAFQQACDDCGIAALACTGLDSARVARRPHSTPEAGLIRIDLPSGARVFLNANPHKRDRLESRAVRRIALHLQRADSLELFAAARRGLEASRRDGFEISKAGIMLDDPVAAGLRPRMLLGGRRRGLERLMTAVDAVNGRFGRNSLPQHKTRSDRTR